jgi:hypothetical protein
VSNVEVTKQALGTSAATTKGYITSGGSQNRAASRFASVAAAVSAAELLLVRPPEIADLSARETATRSSVVTRPCAPRSRWIEQSGKSGSDLDVKKLIRACARHI